MSEAAEYMRAYRATNPVAYARMKKRDAARKRALARLGRIHRAELEALIREELAR